MGEYRNQMCMGRSLWQEGGGLWDQTEGREAGKRLVPWPRLGRTNAVRSDDGMTEEGGLNRPHLSTLSVLFSVPKPPQENSQSLIVPVSLGKPIHLDLDEQVALQTSPLPSYFPCLSKAIM